MIVPLRGTACGAWQSSRRSLTSKHRPPQLRRWSHQTSFSARGARPSETPGLAFLSASQACTSPGFSFGGWDVRNHRYSAKILNSPRERKSVSRSKTRSKIAFQNREEKSTSKQSLVGGGLNKWTQAALYPEMKKRRSAISGTRKLETQRSLPRALGRFPIPGQFPRCAYVLSTSKS
jgi:hypothetical protein